MTDGYHYLHVADGLTLLNIIAICWLWRVCTHRRAIARPGDPRERGTTTGGGSRDRGVSNALQPRWAVRRSSPLHGGGTGADLARIAADRRAAASAAEPRQAHREAAEAHQKDRTGGDQA